MNIRDLLFVDTETTGLDVKKHEVIEVAWIHTGPDPRDIKEKYLARMMPLDLAAADPDALRINGFDEVKWKTGPLSTQGEVAERFHKLSQKKVLVGQNVGFDEAFMTKLLASNGLVPAWHYQKVDTIALAWPLYTLGDLGGVSLDKLCTFLGIKQERKHSADADVESCYRVYLALMARYGKLDLTKVSSDPQLPLL